MRRFIVAKIHLVLRHSSCVQGGHEKRYPPHLKFKFKFILAQDTYGIHSATKCLLVGSLSIMLLQ